MHGRNLLFLLLVLAGCHDYPPQDSVHTATAAGLAADFDPADRGTIVGRVTWQGLIPEVPPFQVYNAPDSQPDLPSPGPRPNPHAPQINSSDRGIQDAVLFLRKVELRRSRPWDHEPVCVEHEDWNLQVRQGALTSRVGFVRSGGSFSAISKQKVLHVLHGEGAAFFSLPLPDVNMATEKRLERQGHVELTSAVGYYWMRAHLLVNDHPYCTRTDSHGKFRLSQVPDGIYQLVCWLPNWNVAWRERDPESAQIARLGFQPPLELERAISVTAGKITEATFSLSAP